MKPLVAAVAVLVALAVGAPVRAQTPEIDALRTRAEQGNADAQSNLGVMYATGEGVLQDDAEAVRWFRVAADQGHMGAQFYLGVMYTQGLGVPQDFVEAVRLYRLAAEQGYALAQFNLGVLYATGEGVQQDDVQAHLWFNLAASRETGEARERAVNNRDRTAGQMTPDDLSEAQRLASEWDAAHPREP